MKGPANAKISPDAVVGVHGIDEYVVVRQELTDEGRRLARLHGDNFQPASSLFAVAVYGRFTNADRAITWAQANLGDDFVVTKLRAPLVDAR